VVRFISFEPLHEEIYWMDRDFQHLEQCQWAIIGGESGNENGLYRYRPCNIEWIEGLKFICESAGLKVFVKQTGTHIAKSLKLKDRHGTDISEWPDSIKCQEMPDWGGGR
jgi:protein gp37